jgi:hypothetical protein
MSVYFCQKKKFYLGNDARKTLDKWSSNIVTVLKWYKDDNEMMFKAEINPGHGFKSSSQYFYRLHHVRSAVACAEISAIFRNVTEKPYVEQLKYTPCPSYHCTAQCKI